VEIVLKRVLLTGIPSHRLFYASEYRDFEVKYDERRKDIRTIANLRQDLKVCGNTGNLLIGEGAKGALEGADFTFLPFWYLMSVVKSPERLAALRDTFDVLVMATANIIRDDYDAATEADVLISIGMPTLLMGAGIQVKDKLAEVPAGTLRLIEFFTADENAVFSRGIDSAQYLSDRGVKNVTPTGCPSVYYRPDGMRKAIQALADFKLSPRSKMMLGGYIGHAQTNRDINFFMPRVEKLAFALQDEFIEYGLELEKNDSEERAYDPVTGEIVSGYHHPAEEPHDLKPTIHIFTDNDDWRAWAAGFEFYFGRRFHGGIIAMQAGVPTVFAAIDDRMREMLNWMGFPFVEGREFTSSNNKGKMLEAVIEGLDPATLRAKYDENEASFRQALRTFIGG